MSDRIQDPLTHDPSTAAPLGATAPAAPARKRGRRIASYAVVAALAAGVVGVGLSATGSLGQGMGFGPPFAHGGPGFGGGFGPHGWGGPFGGRAFDPAQAEQRADRMVRHLAVELDATTEQQDKLRAIVKSALKDVLPMREKVRAARGQARDLLTAQTIDRAAIEKLRAEQIGLADQASKRIAQALGDAAEVLTPEQRRKLEERLPPAGFLRGWSRG
ncbi:Spy/CpxP family protein refolding chaperone [Rhodoplanes sp. TEM]|uniref:Spy/CpxP family protein refolding chaperone n=1 Tax=Rhodoplanes tepidamans TaxID=200616 RepID=A0ABT5J4J3_RHOTP|nr:MULTISPECIES: Spy/CpxP family protein refolding chaperone [Rhodoplanes]MDC7784560.1 Spy/CpxP family protein refolding chaperone [Rhodoplanes tepidamans]MDC7984467.1 Spy/CpxP family protein refolding chaperone [Rhodoplanes sp. TEM]MDQ0355788.1 Spy/CpxP family protein refolding chaperone [Rhodoplanes tepidamans]